MQRQPDDAAGQGNEEGYKNPEADEPRVLLKRENKFEQDVNDARAIAEGEPTRSDSRAPIGSNDPKRSGENCCDEQINGQHKGCGTHGPISSRNAVRMGPGRKRRVNSDLARQFLLIPSVLASSS